ncbi:MAG: amino acid adenylation domain-containing protein [Calditrichaceae bacterium]
MDKNIESVYSLSPMQQGMIFHSIFSAESSVYFEQTTFNISGEFNTEAFKKSVEEAVQRNPILRTSFVYKKIEKMLQVVHKSVEVPIEELDWIDFSENQIHEKLSYYLKNDRAKGFNLSKAPLLRLAVIRIGRQVWQIVWSNHHSLIDGWSLPLLFKEIFTLYESFVANRDIRLEKTRPYRDYINWINQQDVRTAEEYWKEKLSDVTAPTPLTVDLPAGGHAKTGGYEKSMRRLSSSLSENISSFTRSNHFTISTLIQAAWSVLLSRYSGEKDVIFGVTVSGRPPELDGVESMIGLFINTLPMRIRVSPGQKMMTFLKEIHQQSAGMRQFEFSALAEVQKLSGIKGNLPLFESIVVFENYPVSSSLNDFDNKIRIFDINAIEQTNYPLTVVGSAHEDIVLEIAYQTDRFDAETINRMLGHLEVIMASMVIEPEQTVSAIKLLTNTEIETIVRSWNKTQTDFPANRCLHEIFEEQAKAHPDYHAVRFDDTILTYSDLNKRANQLAAILKREGVGPEYLVAVYLNRSPEMIISVLAVLKAGGAYLPIDPSTPDERLKYILEDSGVGLILSENGLKQKLPSGKLRVIDIKISDDLISGESDKNPECAASSENLAYIIYTSGSTGRPKGTLLRHLGAVNTSLALAKVFHISAGKSFFQLASISFDASVVEIFSTLLEGGCLIMSDRDTLLSEERLTGLLRDQKVTTFVAPPSLLAILSEKDLPDLDVVGSVGEPCTRDTASRWRIGRNFVNGYGPTEVTVCATVFPIHEDLSFTDNIPIGKPIDNVRAYTLNEQFYPQPQGVPGELCISSPGIARGYLNNPGLTAEKFIPDPFSDQPGSRLYRSGDIVRSIGDGNLAFIGRIDDQVKIRGFRIEPGEIESVLSNHKDLKKVVVTVFEKTPGEKALIAYYMPEFEKNPDAESLKCYLKEHLPEYMIPVYYIAMNQFPVSSSGKIDRAALAVPEGADLIRDDKYAAPGNQVDELLTSAWSKILGIEKIGIHDNFFDLGGHSLTATRLASRIRDIFAVEISLPDFFSNPTIAALAKQIGNIRDDRNDQDIPALAPEKRDAETPLSFSQQRLWFLDQLAPGNAYYNIPSALHLHGHIDLGIFERCLNQIIVRHEILRTVFKSEKGHPHQVILPELKIKIENLDLSGIPDDEKHLKSQKITAEDARQSFNLESGPLLRAKIIKLKSDDHILLITIHHIIADGWSIGVLLNEFASLYKAFKEKKESPLDALPIQYADFSIWQRNWLQGEKLKKEIEYWKNKIGTNPPVLELPADHPRPATQTFNGRTIKQHLSGGLSDDLLQLSRKEGTTLFMTLLAAYQTLLHRYTGQDEILVGSPIAGRTRSEMENLIGFFVNTLVLKAEFWDMPTFKQLLKQVRDTTLNAFMHQDLPFEYLVEALQPERNMSHSPLFQVAFVLQNAPFEMAEMPEFKITPIETENLTAKYDLTLTIAKATDGMDCYFEFNTDLFDPATILRMQNHFENILIEIISNPDKRVSELGIIGKDELKLILSGWNDIKADYPDSATVHQWFEQLAEEFPDTVAVTQENQSLTYKKLNEKANQLARMLIKHGIGADKITGICLPRSMDIPVSVMAILKAGGSFLPIDPVYPKDRIEYMIKDSGISALITHEAILANLPETDVHMILLDKETEIFSSGSEKNPESKLTPENLAYVIYTSGSTGRPKGTLLPHRGLLNLANAQKKAFGIRQGSRILQFASLSFDASVWEIVMALLNGGTLCLAGKDELLAGQNLYDILKNEKITTVTLPPSVLAVLPDEPLPDLMTIITAGEKCTIDLARRWSEGRSFFNAYGPTETTVCASMYQVDPEAGLVPPIGRPIDNFRLYILDKSLQPVPTGTAGELHIGGVGLARGYLNRPGLTAEKFIPDSFSESPGSRLYKSGDLVRYLPDGNIEFLGRIDQQVKIRGFRIEPGEIEAIIDEFDDVHETFVMVREDLPGDKRLVAYIVTVNGHEPDVSELKSQLNERLPGYMIPSSFVMLDAMPLTPNGKIDRKALPEPEFSRESLRSVYTAPTNETEEKLSVIVTELLNLDKTGIHDNFFELGGHSLLATQFMSQIRERFSADLPLSLLFEKPTVAELSREIIKIAATDGNGEPVKIQRADRDGEDLEALLLSIDKLSEDETKTMLNQKLKSNKRDMTRNG